MPIFTLKSTLAVTLLFLIFAASGKAQTARRPNVATVTVETANPVNRFRPDAALGAGVDGHEAGDTARIYRSVNLAAMRSAGFGPLSYRLRSELGVEAWHWNPAGAWSSPKTQSGYWTSADRTTEPLKISNGYQLPRRGGTSDQANNRGYSRLDDGDRATFWKSNPYLDLHFTGENDALHPQWIMLDFGKAVPLNTIRVVWGTPFAVRYRVEYWTQDDPINFDPRLGGVWRAFPQGVQNRGAGGTKQIRLSARPTKVQYLRVLMTESSKTAPPGSTDVRDGFGYAIREIYAGTLDAAGRFSDFVRHSQDAAAQTVTYASSTDSWHRAADLDRSVEQPGFDTIFGSGLTNGLPMLTPVALAYDTPENAAAEIRYLKAKGVPLTQIELGEEPDGQYMAPEDYGALYLQFAAAIHAAAPELLLGGPGFQTDVGGWYAWPDAQGNTSWMNRFLRYLKRRGRMTDFNFFTFEWYPFDNVCAPPAPQLAAHYEMLKNIMRLLDRDGLPRDLPRIITEYGYSSYAMQAEVELPGALLNAEIAAEFLTLGGKAAYLYGLEPGEVISENNACNAWGNLMLFQAAPEGRASVPLPCYYGAKLLTQEWTLPGNGLHEIFTATCSNPLVTAFAVHRPDGQWAVLLLNKNPKHACEVRLEFHDAKTGAVYAFGGKRRIAQYSPKQYHWRADGENGRPSRNLPPEVRTVSASNNAPILLPAYSITVVREMRKTP